MSDSLRTAIFSIGVRKTVFVAITFFFVPILVRLLGPSEYGQYAVVLSIFFFVNVFMTTGTRDAVRKYISEKSDRQWQNAVFGYIFWPTIGLGILAAVFFVVAAWTGLARMTFGEGFTVLFYLLAVFAMGRQLREFLIRTLMGLQMEYISEPIRILERLIFVALALLAAYSGYGVEGVLVSDVITSIVIIPITAAFLRGKLSFRSQFSALTHSDLPRREITRYIGSVILISLFLTSLYHVDILLLQHWTSSEIVGYYKGSLTVAEFLWLIPSAVQLSLLQRVSQHWKRNEISRIQNQAMLVTRYVVLITTLLAIGIAALAHDFVPLYFGEEFRPSIVPLLLLLPGVIGFAAARPTLAINQGRRSLRPVIIATAACSLVNLVLNVILIPSFGMIGAAVATSTGYGSLMVFQTVAARKLGYYPYRDMDITGTIATVAISGGFIFGIARLLPSSVLSLIVVPPLGLIIFVLIGISLGAIKKSDLDELTRFLPDSVVGELEKVFERIPKLSA